MNADRESEAETGSRITTVMAPTPERRAHSVWPHRLAVITAVATFPLLFIGGLVTSKGAGLAVPDWPTTFGYNMFLFPWSEMVGHVFYEHSHRLVASGVGVLTIALALVTWLREPRAWVRGLAVAALVLVIVQGVLGGLRVVLLEHGLAIVHAAFAQAFFGLVVALAVFTSRGWHTAAGAGESEDYGKVARLALITTTLIYLQVIFGAVLRHTGERLDVHLVLAALILVHVLLAVNRVVSLGFDNVLVRPAYALAVLTLVQWGLGAASYFGKFTTVFPLSMNAVEWLTTTHLAVGALMLALSLLLTLRSRRIAGSWGIRPTRRALTERLPA